MADSYFPTLVSKDRNVNAVNNVIWTQLSDGTTAIGVTSGALDVNIDNVSIAVTASDLDIRDLVAGTGTGEDNILIFANTVKDGSGTDYVPLVDADGNLQVDVLTMPAITINAEYVDDTQFTVATDYVLALGAMFDDASTDSVDEDDIGILRMTADRKLLNTETNSGAIKTAVEIMDDWDNGSDQCNVDIAAISVTAFPVSATTALNTEVNPIFVQVVSGATSGNEVCNYDTSTVAGDTPDNHDYAVAGATFMLKSVIASASGGLKFEIQTGPVATLATIAVGFIPKQGGTQQLFFDPPVEVPVTSTGTVRVIRTNRESSSQDVYSTIEGYDL